LAISKRDKRFLRLGVLAIIIFVVIQYVFIPFYHREIAIRERIKLLELTKEKYQKIISKRDEIEEKINQLRLKENRLDNKLLKGNTPSLAAAEMQKMLEKLSNTSDLELKRVKVQKPEKVGEFLSIPIEVRLTTDLKKTMKFLKGIEKSNKLMVISKLRIYAKRRRDPKLLIVRLVVKGFMEEAA